MRELFETQSEYLGAGNLDEYTFDFKISDLTELLVIEIDDTGVETQRVRGDDVVYISSVSFDANDGGGTVTLAADLPTDYRLILMLAPDEPTQAFEFKNKFDFTLKRVEDALDYMAGVFQRLTYRAERSVQLHEGDDVADFDPALPIGVAANTLDLIPSVTDGGWAPIADWTPVTDLAAAVAAAAAAAVSEAAAAASELAALNSQVAAAASASDAEADAQAAAASAAAALVSENNAETAEVAAELAETNAEAAQVAAAASAAAALVSETNAETAETNAEAAQAAAEAAQAAAEAAAAIAASFTVATGGSNVTGTVSTVITLTAPANTVGFILQSSDANTTNMRWKVGGTATASDGNQLQPGRDTAYVPSSSDISIVSESGTNEYQIQWFTA